MILEKCNSTVSQRIANPSFLALGNLLVVLEQDE